LNRSVSSATAATFSALAMCLLSVVVEALLSIKHFLRLLAAEDSKNAPARGARGGMTWALKARMIRLSSPARDVRTGLASPGRSLRPPRKRDSIQRSSVPTAYTNHGPGFESRLALGLEGREGSRVPLGWTGTGAERGQGAPAPLLGGAGCPCPPMEAGRGRTGGAGRAGTRNAPRRRPGRVRERKARSERGTRSERKGQAVASARSSSKLRVLLGSTGMPGAIVVVKVTFFRYLPLAAAGLSLMISSRAAA